jgi:hypothetical protein
MIMSGHYVRIQEETVLAYLQVLSHHSLNNNQNVIDKDIDFFYGKDTVLFCRKF